MYEQHILRVLSDVGERGISVRLLAKHVYNLSCTLFHQPDFREVYDYTQRYLLNHSRSPRSVIERAGKRGYYRLNTGGSQEARQLVLMFHNEEDTLTKDDDKTVQDLSLNLFPDFFP